MTRGPRRVQSTGVPSLRSWRVTTAVRVFALALSVGQLLSAEVLGQTASILFALALIAFVSSVLEFGVIDRGTPWIPVAEGVLAATLLTSALPVDSLLVYLAVPALVAGVRHGSVTTINTVLLSTAAVAATTAAYRDLGVDIERLATSGSWLVIGLGSGLLAARQGRALRRLEASQAPYAAAHSLVAQLHTLTQKVTVGLDSPSTAARLAGSLSELADASRWAVLVGMNADELRPVASHGAQDGLVDAAVRCLERGAPTQHHGVAALVLRVGEHVLGALALDRASEWPPALLDALQSRADEQSLRLETALLFDDIRAVATSEERNRLARDMHDGVAQELVALGYLVDEIEALSEEPATRATAALMRGEVTRLVSELRLSIFDLRHEVSDQSLSDALSQYVREVGAGPDLRVHLVLEERGTALPRRTESELMRVAQEAITNVRKHARARNLWVTFETDGSWLRLRIEDDGVGSAGPRQRHYGMHTMRERAARIHAELTVSDRLGGGTVVSLQSRPPAPIGDDLPHELHSPAGR